MSRHRPATADWSAAMRDAADMATVLSFRLPLIWLETPGALAERERGRMGPEKTTAAMAGMTAAWWEMWTFWMTAWTTPMTAAALARATERAGRAAYAPTRRTLRANARRLAARKTR